MIKGDIRMYRKALINRIRNQIIEMKTKLKTTDGRGKYKIEQGIKRKYSLLYFLVNINTLKVDIKELEKKFKTKLSG